MRRIAVIFDAFKSHGINEYEVSVKHGASTDSFEIKVDYKYDRTFENVISKLWFDGKGKTIYFRSDYIELKLSLGKDSFVKYLVDGNDYKKPESIIFNRDDYIVNQFAHSVKYEGVKLVFNEFVSSLWRFPKINKHLIFNKCLHISKIELINDKLYAHFIINGIEYYCDLKVLVDLGLVYEVSSNCIDIKLFRALTSNLGHEDYKILMKLAVRRGE